MTKHAKPEKNQAVALRSGAKLFSSLQREIDHLFEDVRKGFDGLTDFELTPAVDVAETPTQITVTAELPGLTAADVDVRIEGDALVISGEKSTTTEETGESFRVSERAYGSFYRAVGLPRGVDPEAIKASMSDGVLKVMVARPATEARQKIEVKAG